MGCGASAQKKSGGEDGEVLSEEIVENFAEFSNEQVYLNRYGDVEAVKQVVYACNEKLDLRNVEKVVDCTFGRRQILYQKGSYNDKLRKLLGGNQFSFKYTLW